MSTATTSSHPPCSRACTSARSTTGAELVLCGMENFTDGEATGVHYPEPDMSVFGHSLAEEPRLLYRVDASACDKLYARELFTRSGIRFPVGLRFEDVPTTYRLLPFANRIEKIDEPLYRYRHDRAASISGRYDERYLDLIEGFRLDRRRLPRRRDLRGEPRCAAAAPPHAPRRRPLSRPVPACERQRAKTASSPRRSSFWMSGSPGGARANVCRELWRNPVLRFTSTHESALSLLCTLPPRVYLGTLVRLGAFDPSR